MFHDAYPFFGDSAECMRCDARFRSARVFRSTPVFRSRYPSSAFLFLSICGGFLFWCSSPNLWRCIVMICGRKCERGGNRDQRLHSKAFRLDGRPIFGGLGAFILTFYFLPKNHFTFISPSPPHKTSEKLGHLGHQARGTLFDHEHSVFERPNYLFTAHPYTGSVVVATLLSLIGFSSCCGLS